VVLVAGQPGKAQRRGIDELIDQGRWAGDGPATIQASTFEAHPTETRNRAGQRRDRPS
jgi:hypothetical protein